MNSTSSESTVRPLSRRLRIRNSIIAAGAIIAVGTAGAMVGTGLSVQSAMAEGSQRAADTAKLNAATGLQHDQLAVYSSVLTARANHAAQTTLVSATGAIAAAQGKNDATGLASSVSALSRYKLLAPKRVFDLVSSTARATTTVKAATAEVDRVAAAAAAAAAAQAAAEAAAQAAADAAAEASAPDASAASRPAAPSNPSEAQSIARSLMASMYGWGDDQFGCLVPLWAAESGWNINSYNSSSGAGGIPQALPASKMASAGADWATNPATQITWGLGYIAGRYGTPCGAWDSFNSHGWY